MCSSSVKEDLEWYYETLTEKSVIQDKKTFQEAGIDPRKESEIFKQYFKQAYIIDKKAYKEGIILIVKIYTTDSAVYTMPYNFVEEYGKWKLTNEFASDDMLLDYMDYSPPLFDGKGQRPADVNTFLAYANPTRIETDLPVDTSKFSLHIFYGETIDPATFKAELNKQDISSRFDPKPVGDQTVELSLKKGRNVLTLSIEGEREDKKKSKDKDRLVFIVP